MTWLGVARRDMAGLGIAGRDSAWQVKEFFMSGDNGKKTIGQISVDTQIVLKRLLLAMIGDVITYAELTQLIGRDIRNGAYGCLVTARRRALNDERFVFRAIPNIGLKRLNDSEIIDTHQPAIAHIRSTMRKSAKELVSVQNFDSLPNEKKIQHNTALSVFGVLQEFTRPKTIASIESKVSEAQARLPVGRMLELFK
jgi:hypothetical protein